MFRFSRDLLVTETPESLLLDIGALIPTTSQSPGSSLAWEHSPLVSLFASVFSSEESDSEQDNNLP